MALCKITFDGWDYRNRITVTSPTGRTIFLTASWGDNISNELKTIFSEWNEYWLNAKFGTGVQNFSYQLTKVMMGELLSLTK